MRTLDIKFEGDRVSLSKETYHELRQFAIHHGETDLPAFPEPKIFSGEKLTSTDRADNETLSAAKGTVNKKT